MASVQIDSCGLLYKPVSYSMLLFIPVRFDSAEDGACLKRYSDPSFFKTNFASTGKMEDEFHRERKSRKNKVTF